MKNILQQGPGRLGKLIKNRKEEENVSPSSPLRQPLRPFEMPSVQLFLLLRPFLLLRH